MWLPLEHTLRPVFKKTRLPASWREIRWGAWAVSCLYVSLFSGVIVGMQYDYATPFYSTTAVDLLVPYGRYFRSLHFFSSQFFFLFACLHLVAVYRQSERLSFQEWLKLCGSLPLILLLLFTGYILKGDNTGTSAGMIAENIIDKIPVLGAILDKVFFSISDTGLRKVYVHHVITLDLFFLFCAWSHLRTYRVNLREYKVLLAAVLCFSVFIPAPLEPEHSGITYIAGPWFFLGLQELLRTLSPVVAGVAAPGIFLAALFAAHPARRTKAISLAVITVWLAMYTVFSAIAWLR